MTQTQTFSQFMADFIAQIAKERPMYVGTAFIDALHMARRDLIANGFIYSTFDPFGKTDVSAEAIAFVERCW